MPLFKNRAMQITMVKTDEDGKTLTPPVETQADVIAFATDCGKELVKWIVGGVLLYVAADTARKVIVELVDNE